MRRDPHAARCVEIVAVEPPQRQRAAGEPLQEQRANMRFILGAAGQRDQVSGLDLARHQRLPIDETDDRPQQKIDEHDESGGERGIGQIARSGEDADRRGAPQRGRGIEPAHAHAFAEDQAGAEKADARYDLRGDTGRARLLRHDGLKHDEARRAQGHQRVRAQAGKAVAPLTLEADERAEAKRDRMVERRLFDRYGRPPIICPLSSSCGEARSRVQTHALRPRRVAYSCASMAAPRPRSHPPIRSAIGIQACRCSDRAAIGTGGFAASPGEERRQGGGPLDCRWNGPASPAPHGGGDRPAVLRVL